LDGEGLPPPPPSADLLHKLLPFAIVLTSVGAATMAWQASVAEERATHADVLSRQDLVREQQIRFQKVQEVDADLRVFGQWERSFLLSDQLSRELRVLPRRERGDLNTQAVAERNVADALEQDLVPGPWIANANTAYDVRQALRITETGDPELSSLEPNRRRGLAKDERELALHLTGLLVLFVVALVFVTTGAVMRSRRAYWFAATGTVCALVATVLYFPVRF
jgi:hypothetical protein